MAAADKVRHYTRTAWLRGLFPDTGPADEFAHRLQRTAMAPLEVDGRQGGQVTCQFIYPEVDGSIQTGRVKFFIPPELKEHPRRRVPLLHMAGYEVDKDGAMTYLKEGIAVSTVHDHPLNPLSRGPKLEWALMHAMRRLPFVDDARVFVKGNSSGGNMALLSAAETFPLTCAMAMVPLVNLTYNLSYVIKSCVIESLCLAASGKRRLPVLASVGAVPEQAATRFGADPEAPSYFELSPVRLVEKITAPVLVVFCTGDMLVPLDQVSLELIRPFNAGRFPDGFTREMSKLLTRPEQQARLLDVIPSASREVFRVPLPSKAKKKRHGGRDEIGEPLEMPFSHTRQWSIAVIDDGPPEPRYGHFKYYIAPDYTAFWHWALGKRIQAEQLTPSKLTLLMKRYQGMEPLDFTITPSTGPAHKCQLLDFPRAERADVLRGLITFARSDAAACRLAELYAALPTELKGLGEELGTGSAESVRQALSHAEADHVVCRSPGMANWSGSFWSWWA